jgi:hypothetical protein
MLTRCRSWVGRCRRALSAPRWPRKFRLWIYGELRFQPFFDNQAGPLQRLGKGGSEKRVQIFLRPFHRIRRVARMASNPPP